MPEFNANRLSSGNRIFPDKVKVEHSGVSLKSPNLFSGKEHTLMYSQISSINTTNPLVGFSTITFSTLTHQEIVCTGFSKADAEEIKRLVQQGIQQERSGHHGGNNGYMETHSVVTIIDPDARIKAEAVIEQASADRAKADADKIKAEADKLKADIDKQKLELEEQRNRELRADHLRSQGRNKQAFIVEHWKMLSTVAGVIFCIAIGIWVLSTSPNKDGDKLDADLTRKDEQIQVLIHDGKKEEALKMIDELQDDNQATSNHTKGLTTIYTYAEYWKTRRDELRKEAFALSDNKPTQTLAKTEAKEQSVNVVKDTIAHTQPIAATNTPQQANNGEQVHNGTVITEKTFFYKEANPATKRKGFLLKGQTVTYTKSEGDFIYSTYTTETGTTTGWLLKSDVQ